MLGREQKAWLKRTPRGVEGDLEGLGRHQRHARHAHRSAEPAGRPDQALAGQGLRHLRRRRLQRRAERAGRALRLSCARPAIDGFVTVSGDRHSFWAGYAAKALPPQTFEPVGVTFICGSISAPGMAEALEHGLKGHPLRPLFVAEREPGKPETTVNLTAQARGEERAGIRPHRRPRRGPPRLPTPTTRRTWSSSTWAATAMPWSPPAPTPSRPSSSASPARSPARPTPDGGPLRYRVRHTAQTLAGRRRPKLEQTDVEGDVGLAV